MSERLKKISYGQLHCDRYFWHTRQQQEIDYIEDYDGVMHAFEFKYSPELRSKFLLTFSKAYPQHSKIPGLALADCNNRQGKPKERFQYSPLSFH
ncbi:MAG: hypothetical protein WC341_12520, partial [Bacteroidales bacterium]